MTNNRYYEKFKEYVANVECLGTEVGYWRAKVKVEFNKTTKYPNYVTPLEIQGAIVKIKQKYLAVIFLINSDNHRYGELIQNIKNDFTLGNHK
jgi:hypothetical protein